jgi:hypothetical protein
MDDTRHTDKGRGACDERLDQLALMTSGDLSDADLAEAMRHLSECEGCRAYWQGLQEDHRALEGISRSLQGRVRAVEDGVIGTIRHDAGGATESRPWWRWIMETRPGRLVAGSTAAAIVVFIMVFMHGTSSTFDAWADVIENVKTATSCRFRAREMGDTSVEGIKTYSKLGYSQLTYEDGENVEQFYVSFTDKTVIHAIPPLKRAVSMTVGERLINRYIEKDPQTIFSEISEQDHEDLGTRRIDGRKTVGMRASGREIVPELVDFAEIEVWADVETKWPVRIEVQAYAADGRKVKRVRWDRFEWNIPVTEEDYDFDIPRGWDVASGFEIEMDEPHAIEGLRGIARVMDRYPSTLAYEQLRPEFWKQLGMRMLTTDVLKEIHKIRATCSFYGELVRADKKVVYFGDRVEPGDGERVLMRWETGDDEYRVVFGDLTVDTVAGDELIELESR